MARLTWRRLLGWAANAAVGAFFVYLATSGLVDIGSQLGQSDVPSRGQLQVAVPLNMGTDQVPKEAAATVTTSAAAQQVQAPTQVSEVAEVAPSQTPCPPTFNPQDLGSAESAARGGWRVQLEHATFSTATSGPVLKGSSGAAALGFTGLGVLSFEVSNTADSKDALGFEDLVSVTLSGSQVLQLRAQETCRLVLAFQPGDELRISALGKGRVSLGSVALLEHRCDGDASSSPPGGASCSPWRQVRLAWTTCLDPVKADNAAKLLLKEAWRLPWAQGHLERSLNATHGFVRLTAPGMRPRRIAGTSAFDPTSPLVSYQDEGQCGPRGDDATAVTDSCPHGVEVVEQVENKDWKAVATYKGCRFYGYTVFRCRHPGAANTVQRQHMALLPESSVGPSAEKVAQRCAELQGNGTQVGLVVVGDAHFQARYAVQIKTLICFAKANGYEFVRLAGNEYLICQKYYDYFFKKHCTVAEWLDHKPAGYVAAIVDADMAAAVLGRGLERWIYHDAEVQLYMRCLLPEIMAGNYMVKNTPFAKHFLRTWANYNFKMPPGFSSSDNGAIHLAVMETVQVEGYEECYKQYRGLDQPVTNLKKYWDFVKCTSDALGPPRNWRVPGAGRLTIWPRLQFWVVDGVYLDQRGSNDIGPLLHHGIKDPSMVKSIYYKSVDRCELNSPRVMMTAEGIGAQALHMATSYPDYFESGKCKQCVESCISTFSCLPLENGEKPVPHRRCGNCT